ncbi:RpiB/LacA/LacB family sugar-phosphate isomerase [Candidatus Nomurabacteria bacterium]|nr:RpiB/LacA/LacB family sugar-phosphate isomerase [Candidatus Nomurabacteria bacterium]
MKIFLAADHAGLSLKDEVKRWLKSSGYTVQDEGAFEADPDDDYPDFIRVVAQGVAANPEEDRGLIFGGSGQGEAMMANRFRNVRAAVYYGGTEKIIILSREHNNANILSFGARFVTDDQAKEMIKLWLETPFTGEERHLRRIMKIDNPPPATYEF